MYLYRYHEMFPEQKSVDIIFLPARYFLDCFLKVIFSQ